MNKRSKQVLIMKANGMHTKQIADELGIHRRTVEERLKKAVAHVKAKNVYHAIARAIRDGIITTGEIGMVLILSWSNLGISGVDIDVRRGPQRPGTSRQATENTR